MSDGTVRHALIVGNVLSVVKFALRGGPCNVYPSDLRVEVGADYVHPDVTVICGETRMSETLPNTVANPAVVFEVLSPTTESFDRGRKLRLYTGVTSLQAYLLVSQESPFVEAYLRQNEDWRWERHEGISGALDIASIGLKLSVADLYEGVDFEEPA